MSAQEQRIVGKALNSEIPEHLLHLPVEKLRLQMARLEADMAAELELIQSRYDARLSNLRKAIALKENTNVTGEANSPNPQPADSLRANRSSSEIT